MDLSADYADGRRSDWMGHCFDGGRSDSIAIYTRRGAVRMDANRPVHLIRAGFIFIASNEPFRGGQRLRNLVRTIQPPTEVHHFAPLATERPPWRILAARELNHFLANRTLKNRHGSRNSELSDVRPAHRPILWRGFQPSTSPLKLNDTSKAIRSSLVDTCSL